MMLLSELFSYFLNKSFFRSYYAYTEDFDVVIGASNIELLHGELSEAQRIECEDAWAIFSRQLPELRQSTQGAVMEMVGRVKDKNFMARSDTTAVSILVDHSGSMRGQNILLAAAACQISHELLAQFNVKTEILGFTTVNWLGGEARALWRRNGRRMLPGRLNDLLHLVYKAADESVVPVCGSLFKPMFRPDLLKENIDGEAIEWALGRLLAIPAQRRTLIVLSDGVPADDATLFNNDDEYLTRHLRKVLVKKREVENLDIIGIGIGDASCVEYFYEKNFRINSVEDISYLFPLLIKGIVV